MRKALALSLALMIGFGAASGAFAAANQCRDAKTGRFIKCPPAAASTNHCRDKKTKKFAKCSAPNTEPVPMKH